MKPFNVDEGKFTLKSDSLQFKANDRGIARGLSDRMAIPFSEIVNVQKFNTSDGAMLVFTLVKDDYQFSVHYPKSSRVQAGKFWSRVQHQDRAKNAKNMNSGVAGNIRNAMFNTFGIGSSVK